MRYLAVLGGKPAFDSPLHVGRPNLGDRDQFAKYVDAIFDQRWLTNRGPLLRQFEQELSKKIGVRHCIAVCNGTIALEIAIRALGLAGEVIVPSFTFVATAHALQWQGITPVFCDIDPMTHNIDPRCVEERITPRTSGILGVHLWGRPCPIQALQKIADANQLKLLFDAAHALGCTYLGKPIGHFGNAEVFSLHATKFFNTFEGGAIVTNDDELAERVRLMVNFGFTSYDQVSSVGTNGKMNEISAAMGLTNLTSWDTFIQANHANYACYRRELARIPGLSLIQYDESEQNNRQYIIVEVDPNLAGLDRDQLIRVLNAENVLARRYFWPGSHRMEPYLTLFPDAYQHLPYTEQMAERVLALPTGSTIREPEIETICDILHTAVTYSEQIYRRESLAMPAARLPVLV